MKPAMVAELLGRGHLAEWWRVGPGNSIDSNMFQRRKRRAKERLVQMSHKCICVPGEGDPRREKKPHCLPGTALGIRQMVLRLEVHFVRVWLLEPGCHALVRAD